MKTEDPRTVFTVKQRPRPVGTFADYIYEVWRDGLKVAEFSHDYRGGEPRLRIGDGRWFETASILMDDEPPPHRISERGVRILEDALSAA